MSIFKNQCAMITGAGSGIGEALAYRFAEAGSSLVLVGRKIERLQKVAERCAALGSAATVLAMDMEDPATIDAGIEELDRKKIDLNFLVLNAGISQRAFTLDTDLSVDRRIMETNYFGAIYLFKKLKRHFQHGRAFHVAVTSSISGLFGFPLRSAYCASKHAQFGFFEAVELEYPNIKVTLLIPGRINTGISKSALLGDGKPNAEMDPGQANGMDVDKAAKIALKAIARNRHKKLIGGKELLMAYFYKFAPSIFYKMGRNPRFYK